MSKLPRDYVERVYAGWLGKVIGVRFGAPIEMWTDEKIAAFYGELDHYVAHFADFAADDDTNGPLFFIRALEDFACDETLTSEQVGRTLLNYAAFEHGFFWWGGYGVSTEHTVYTNLRAGIPAPQCGSMAQNGFITSEQIGGQIFIDTWGLVNPGDYRRAARFAQKAASMLCDGNGVYGGMFVAACVSAAFADSSSRSVVEKALSVIPEESTYARMARDVMRFYDENPGDFRACLAYIKQHYWMDKFIGNCHILPNAAIIVLSLLYGESDFDKTLCIGNMCGFDTDCNVGNLGAIMGVMRGLDGIGDKWIDEIHDFQACSSVVGCLNITDVASSALYLARLGYMIAGEEAPEGWRALLACRHPNYHFEFPRSTQAVRAYRADGETLAKVALRNTDRDAHTGHRCLQISSDQWRADGALRACVRTYYEKADFANGRYEPVTSPIAYPGQTARAYVKSACPHALRACLYMLDAHGRTVTRGAWAQVTDAGWTALTFPLPAGTDACVREVGVEVVCADDNANGYISLYLDDLSWSGAGAYTVNWQKESNWGWHARDTRVEISQFTRLKGIWHVLDGALLGHCADFGEVYTGDVAWENYRVKTTLTPQSGAWHALLCRAQGACRSYALALCGEGLALCKNEDGHYRALCSSPLAWRHGETYALEIAACGNQLTAYVNGEKLLQYTDISQPYAHGMVGLALQKAGVCRFGNITITPVREDEGNE